MRRDAGVRDQVAELRNFPGDARAQLLRSAADHHQSGLAEFRGNVRLADRRHDLRAEPVDDTAADVIAAKPDIIVGSWCGKKFVPAKVSARAGFGDVPAVRTGWLREIKSALILQPGPAALTDGLEALEKIVAQWAESASPERVRKIS